MIATGTVIDGRVEFDSRHVLPNGSRVFVDLLPPEEEIPEHLKHLSPHERELEILRESIREGELGLTKPAREVLRELAIRNNLPFEDDELE